MLAFIHRGHSDPGFFALALTAMATEPLLRAMPGNVPPDSGGYVCLVPVFSDADLLVRPGLRWHYSELEDEVLADVRAGRAVIVLDHSTAGPDLGAAALEALYGWVEANDLPAGRVIWLAQNRAMAARARALAGMRAHLVRFACFDFYLRGIAWLFSPWSHAPVLGRDAEAAIAAQLDPAKKDRLLLCLNGKPRPHRIVMLAALLQHGLVDGSLVSFPAMASAGAHFAAAERFVAAHPALAYLAPTLATLPAMPAMAVDAPEARGKMRYREIDPASSARSYFSMVTEGDFSDGRIDRASEIAAKAFCLGHPALVLGNPHAVRHLTALGFQDWDAAIDRSSEAIAAPGERFAAVLGEILRQSALVRADPQLWLGGMREVSAFNIRHAVSGGMLAAYTASIDRPVVALLQRLVAGVPAE